MTDSGPKTPTANSRLERAQQALAKFEGLSKEAAEERREDLRERFKDVESGPEKEYKKFVRQMWLGILLAFLRVAVDHVWDYLVAIVQKVPD